MEKPVLLDVITKTLLSVLCWLLLWRVRSFWMSTYLQVLGCAKKPNLYHLDIFKELIVKPSTYLAKLPSKFSKNATSQAVLKSQKLLSGLDPWRDKRGALHLAGIIKCATNCNPLSFKGMPIQVVEFSRGDTKLEGFLPKHQLTQRKLSI